MHFILEVELKDPPTAPGLALADDKADNGTYTRSKMYIGMGVPNVSETLTNTINQMFS